VKPHISFISQQEKSKLVKVVEDALKAALDKMGYDLE